MNSHTPTHTPLLPTTADTASVTSGISHEVPEDDLDRRLHLRLVGPLPCESLNAGQVLSACRGRTDRDIPPNMLSWKTEKFHRIPGTWRMASEVHMSSRGRVTYVFTSEMVGGLMTAIPQGSAARNENREPRYYRDCDIPCGHTEIIPAQSVPRPVPRPRNPTASTSQYGIRDEARPLNSTESIEKWEIRPL